MEDKRRWHITVMQRELEYLYEILEGSESKSEKLMVQKRALQLYRHIENEQKMLAR
jgi:hypothetical protein